jgi:hypothetical protein
MKVYKCDNHRAIKTEDDFFRSKDAAVIFAQRKNPKHDHIIVNLNSQSKDYTSATFDVFSGTYNSRHKISTGTNYQMVVHIN